MQTPPTKKPSWLKVKLNISDNYKDMKGLMEKHTLNTVCEEAMCPNLHECWSKKHATMMIMGEICTRSCSFCKLTPCLNIWAKK